MSITDDGAVNIRSRRGRAGGVAETVGRGITGDDCVFQSHARRTDTNAAARAFGGEARRFVNSGVFTPVLPA